MIRRHLERWRSAASRAWANPAGVVFAVVDRVPVRIRRPIARPFVALTGRVAGRMPGSRVAVAAAFLAAWAAGPVDRAVTLARRWGTSADTSPAARRTLASLALSARQTDVAGEIAASIPDDHSPRLELVRAMHAFELGRYRDAEVLLEAAAGTIAAPRVARRVAGALAVIQPGWRPDPGLDPARATRSRGTPTAGRVLHLVAWSLPHRVAGYTIRTQDVARSQRGVGLDPHVATRAGFPLSDGISGAPRDELVDGIPHHHVAPMYRADDRQDVNVVATARATAKLVEELRPAVLQPASNQVQAQVALAVGRPLGIPVVYEVRGFWEDSWAAGMAGRVDDPEQTDRYRLTRDTETEVMLAADAVVTLSETMRAELVDRGIPTERITVVPNAVDIERFTPAPRDAALAASLGLGARDEVVGYVSSFRAFEGIPLLLEAAAALRAQGRPIRVLLVGDGPDGEAIRRAGHRLGLDDGTLVMTGRVAPDQVSAYYALIDAFVVPRTPDRVSRLVTPLKPYEAMALERAVIVSDVPALREMVIPGQTGLTFRAADAADLTTVLGTLLEDRDLRQRLGRQAREWVIAERTWASNGRRYRDLFERLGVA